MHTKVLRIVISSPSDVRAERDAVEAAVETLNPVLLKVNVPFQFRVSRWERDAIPGLHPSGPQGRIDEALNIPDCDFLVGIFWKRFGTPVAGSGSGTEHEIRQAIAAWEKKRSPQLLLYFNEIPFAAETPEAEAQSQKLKAFVQELLSSVNPPLIKRYCGPDEFQNEIFQSLLRSALNLHQAANTNRPSPLRFAAVAQPVQVRSEGYAELVGDIFLTCTYAVDAPAADSPLWVSLLVYLNTSVTSRLSGTPGMPLVSETLLIEVGRPGVAKVNYGAVSGTTVTFDRVELKGMQPGETRTFRITNIRCNATNLSGHRIAAWVSVAGLGEVFRVDLGMPIPALSFVARSEEPKRLEPPNADGAVFVYTPVVLTFREEFGNAFKTNASMSSMLFREGPIVLLAESSVEGPHVRIPGSASIAGIADCGTKFGVRCKFAKDQIDSGPDPGIRIFLDAVDRSFDVPDRDPSNQGAPLRLLQ
jgi:hypothetical protein